MADVGESQLGIAAPVRQRRDGTGFGSLVGSPKGQVGGVKMQPL